jgi:hypothetical protein
MGPAGSARMAGQEQTKLPSDSRLAMVTSSQ